MSNYEPRWRNKLAELLANFALRHIATSHYRDMIEGSIRLGLRAATWGDPDLVERMVRARDLPIADYIAVPVFRNHDWSEPVGKLEVRSDVATTLCSDDVSLLPGYTTKADRPELMEMSVVRQIKPAASE